MQKNTLQWKFLVAGMLFLGLTGCQIVPIEEELPAPPVISEYEAEEYVQTFVMQGDLVLEENIVCRYIPARQEDLYFGVSGEVIEEVYVTEGQQVKAGELLAELSLGDLPEQISNLEYHLQVLELEKEHLLTNKELELQRQDIWLKPLGGKEEEEQLKKKEEVEDGFDKQIQAVEDSLYIERLRLETLKEEKSKRQIYAGIDGIVTYIRFIDRGQKSAEEQKMFTVADMGTTVFMVSGDDAGYFPVGTEVTITSTNGKEEYAAVSVEGNGLGVNEIEEGQVAYLQLMQSDMLLKEGDSGFVKVILDERKDVLYLDKAAVKVADNQHFVYVLNEDGWKVMQDVTVGLETEKYIEITGGLKEGDGVILE